jgi:hypothetical protein
MIRPFVLLLRHGYGLLENTKSIRELEMWKIRNEALGHLYKETNL